MERRDSKQSFDEDSSIHKTTEGDAGRMISHPSLAELAEMQEDLESWLIAGGISNNMFY